MDKRSPFSKTDSEAFVGTRFIKCRYKWFLIKWSRKEVKSISMNGTTKILTSNEPQQTKIGMET